MGPTPQDHRFRRVRCLTEFAHDLGELAVRAGGVDHERRAGRGAREGTCTVTGTVRTRDWGREEETGMR